MVVSMAVQWKGLILILLLSVYCHIARAEDSNLDSSIAHRLVTHVYQPLHAEFAETSARWATGTIGLCQRPPASSVYKLQVGFMQLVQAFGAVELFRIGPLLEDNLQHRLFFWPDKRAIGERQLRVLVASLDKKPVTAQQLAEKSVAVQGFTALERLLFTPGYLPVELAPQCHLLPVVMENIAEMAEQLDNGWQSTSEFAQLFLSPQADSTYFRSTEEVARSVFTQIKVGLDIVIDGKLRPLLSGDKTTVKDAPLWISQRTVAMLTGNIHGLEGLLFESGLLDDTEVAAQLGVEFEYINHVLRQLKPVVRFKGDDDKLRPEVRVLMNKLAAVIAGVRHTVNNDVADQLGLSAGFNSEDGD